MESWKNVMMFWLKLYDLIILGNKTKEWTRAPFAHSVFLFSGFLSSCTFCWVKTICLGKAPMCKHPWSANRNVKKSVGVVPWMHSDSWICWALWSWLLFFGVFFGGVLVFQEVLANWKSSMLHKILLQFFILKDRQKSCWCRWCPISSTWYFMQSSMISPQRQNLHSTPTGEASLSSTPDSFVFNTLTKTCDLQEGFEKLVGWVWGEVAPNWGWRFGGLFIFKGIFLFKAGDL